MILVASRANNFAEEISAGIRSLRAAIELLLCKVCKKVFSFLLTALIIKALEKLC